MNGITVEQARQLRDERRVTEQKSINIAERKVEKYAKAGKTSCIIRFKAGWKSTKCYEYLTKQGFVCEWTHHTNCFKCKW